MGLFGKSFEEKVAEAVDKLRGTRLGVTGLSATVSGKIVTLTGTAESPEAKGRLMQEFNALVETENTINQVRVERPPAPSPAAPAAAVAASGLSAAIAGGATPTAQAATASATRAEAEPAAAERWHDVVSGDTLGKLAKKYYGNASQYPRIFEANRDQLDNPDLIKVGQRLRIP